MNVKTGFAYSDLFFFVCFARFFFKESIILRIYIEYILMDGLFSGKPQEMTSQQINCRIGRVLVVNIFLREVFCQNKASFEREYGKL
ncbi:hypothetical protein SRABI96_03364 [Peribacillus sp. Bi96]|nr:hypothetical protein SRABI96_03364 [Peribacillus sp. Bi96]